MLPLTLELREPGEEGEVGTFTAQAEPEAVADAVAMLPVVDRIAFVDLLRERFCLNCGDDYNTDGVCYCTRDDWDERHGMDGRAD